MRCGFTRNAGGVNTSCYFFVFSFLLVGRNGRFCLVWEGFAASVAEIIFASSDVHQLPEALGGVLPWGHAQAW